MTIDVLLNGKKTLREIYGQLRATTIQDAADEPLKLREVAEQKRRVSLPTGEPVDYATGLCFACLQDLLQKFARKYKPDDVALTYMAKQMSNHFPDWSVLDLPTFVSMCVSARIPTMRLGDMEYELVALDIPSILGKVEAYDRMRPGKIASQRMVTPTCREREWNPDHEHMLFDGTPHEFGSVEEAKRYWKSVPDINNPGEKKRVLNGGRLLQEVTEKVS